MTHSVQKIYQFVDITSKINGLNTVKSIKRKLIQ
jgi:hypothetical protein